MQNTQIVKFVRQILGICLLASIALNCQLSAVTVDYLPILGPSPLRYMLPVTGKVTVLPPLLMEDRTPAIEPVKIPNIAKAPPDDVKLPLNLPAQPTNALPLFTNLPLLVPMAAVPQAPAAQSTNLFDNTPVQTIAPQTLLQFFQRSGASNGAGSIVVPVQFSPPATTADRSSSATFQIAPGP